MLFSWSPHLNQALFSFAHCFARFDQRVILRSFQPPAEHFSARRRRGEFLNIVAKIESYRSVLSVAISQQTMARWKFDVSLKLLSRRTALSLHYKFMVPSIKETLTLFLMPFPSHCSQPYGISYPSSLQFPRPGPRRKTRQGGFTDFVYMMYCGAPSGRQASPKFRAFLIKTCQFSDEKLNFVR